MERIVIEANLVKRKLYHMNNNKYRFIRRYTGFKGNRYGFEKIEVVNFNTHQIIVLDYSPRRPWIEDTDDNKFKFGKRYL